MVGTRYRRLDAQPYLRSVTFQPRRPKDALNLNCFRNYWLNTSIRARSKADSLCKMHFYLLSILDRYRDDEPWLELPKLARPLFPSPRIIINRSWRHRNWDFPWGDVLKRFKDKLLFVGLEKEHDVFNIAWGHVHKVQYRPSVNFLDLAETISQGMAYIGNQSFGMALAIALGQNVLQEVYDKAPDCIFTRKNFKTKLEEFKA